jgi:hypothetical protein
MRPSQSSVVLVVAIRANPPDATSLNLRTVVLSDRGTGEVVDNAGGGSRSGIHRFAVGACTWGRVG